MPATPAAPMTDTPTRVEHAPALLGTRLRERRRALELTLKTVARRAGLSIGFISQVERGLASPSLSSLVSIARALDAPVTRFLEQPRGDAPVTRRERRARYSIDRDPVRYERLSAAFEGNVLNSVIVHEPPGHRSEPIAHEGEEMFYLLEGAITVELDGQATVLGTGDSMHFASTRRHSTWNHTERVATFLHVCTLDVFGDRPPDGFPYGARAPIPGRQRRPDSPLSLPCCTERLP